MEILERYLHAIEFWLPKEQRHDIIAELSEDIHSEIEERENQLGRKLNESEMESLVKQRGRPVLVANRYVPQRYLIGPVLFRIYVFVLKIFALCYLPAWGAVFITLYRVQHPGSSWIGTIGVTLSQLWTGTFIGASVITLIFAILQRFETQRHFLENWDPRQLPPAGNVREIPRVGSAIEVVVHVAVAIWWISNAWSPEIMGVHLSFTPVWMYFFWGLLAITLLNAALSVVNLMRPHWTSARAWCRLLVDTAGSVLFCSLLRANVIASFSIAGVPPSQVLEIRNGIQIWIERSFPLAVIGVVVIFIINMFRVIRWSKKSVGVEREAVAVL